MAKKFGRYIRFAIGDGASPEVFTEIAGQTGVTWSSSTNYIDASSKSDYPYAVRSPGREDISIEVSGKLVLPDANGLEATHAAIFADPKVAKNVRLLDVEPSPDTTIFEASMFLGNWNAGADDEDNRTFSFTATLAATPTTNDLTP